MGSTSWWRAWFPVFLIAAFIFAASSVPGDSMPTTTLIPAPDKFGHLTVYGLLGCFSARAFRLRAPGKNPALTFLVAVSITLGYGLTDEFHQSFVPGRAVEALDVVADVLGGLLGASLVLGLAWSRRLIWDRSSRRLRMNQKP